jgi:23S rRNA pseudouridine1911/1915/1917 synthase
MSVQNWKFIVEESEAHLRLDQLVSARTGLSRRRVREILKLGGIQVGKKRVRVASKEIASGTEVRVALDDSLGEIPDLDVPVIFEDEWLLVVNKPAGMATQGTQASDRHDLLALLGRQRPGERLILCHRLDQGTSGVLVLAKDPKADLGSQFQSREIQKAYLVRVSESLSAIEVDKPIGRLRLSKPARFACEGDLLEPKPSLTAFRPASVEETEGLIPGHWIVAEPRTGRTHQIRVHLLFLGRPVLGDKLYDGQPSDQLWLHAWKLRLRHPVTGEALELVAEPERFKRSVS